MSQSTLATINISSLRQDGDALTFGYDDAFGRHQTGIILYWNEELYAYKNICPHWSTPLDEHGAELVDTSCGDLVCQTHGARFEAHSGICISGPCIGEQLEKLVVDSGDGTTVDIRRAGLALG